MKKLTQGRMFFGENFLHDAVVAGERELSGEQLEHHYADGKNIGTAVEGLILEALGRHVLEGADDVPCTGEMAIGFFLAGDSEIEQFHNAIGLHDHVSGFDIAMDDVIPMRVP